MLHKSHDQIWINGAFKCRVATIITGVYPPAREASREVENFDRRKKHTPTRILCQKFVCLSVTKFNPNYLRTGKIEQAKTNLT